MTLENSPNATSSLESVDGYRPCDWLAGHQPSLFGQEVAPIYRFRVPATAKVRKTNGTSGQNSTASLASAALQSSLANKLHQAMGKNGSTEYRLTWKKWTMPSRRQICAQRGSARRTSNSESFGWHTPKASGGSKGGPNQSSGSLPNDVAKAGWSTLWCWQQNLSEPRLKQ